MRPPGASDSGYPWLCGKGRHQRKVVRKGWTNKGHYECDYLNAEVAPRQGCRWTPREDLDILLAIRRGKDVWTLARRHQRTVNAIGMRIGDPNPFSEVRGLSRAEKGAAGFIADVMEQELRAIQAASEAASKPGTQAA